MVGAGEEEAAGLGIPELRDHRLRQRPRLFEPARVERRFVKREQSVNHVSVIFEIAVQLALAVFVRPEQSPVAPQPGQQKVRVPDRNLKIIFPIERAKPSA